MITNKYLENFEAAVAIGFSHAQSDPQVKAFDKTD
jgi:hypothetical protein